MIEEISTYRDFSRRQATFMADIEREATNRVTAFCRCSLSTDKGACSSRRRSRSRRSHRHRSRGIRGRSADPGDRDGPGSSIVSALAPRGVRP